ncbi:hypothetical protein RSAG8_11619, partial [Rhizoctonia solani AG-8 WAC10335]
MLKYAVPGLWTNAVDMIKVWNGNAVCTLPSDPENPSDVSSAFDRGKAWPALQDQKGIKGTNLAFMDVAYSVLVEIE